jgi:uncharacterized protein YecE (DUF72 family)
LHHVVEPRHTSFQVPEFIDMLARHNVAAVCADHPDYPMFADVTADFVYARLQCGTDDVPTCYPMDQIDVWAKRFQTYSAGETPTDLPVIAPARAVEKKPRDVFAFFITGGKVNAPTGAQRLQEAVAV